MDGPVPRFATAGGALDVRQPAARALPLVLASPHSGAEYPSDLLAASRLDPLTLRRSEDSFVDVLFGAAPELGAPLLAACLSGGTEAADFVLGDCHGTSCTPEIIEAAREFLTERHFTVALNAPYSGGFTTGHYGCPERHRHALQIEINRALYMEERSYRRKPSFSRLAVELAELIDRLSQIMQDCLPRR